MSVNGPVKVWKLQPGLEHYRPGMELGQPHEIQDATAIIRQQQKEEDERQLKRVKSGWKRRKGQDGEVGE